MARKIGVLQEKSDDPVTYVKKSVAYMMVRRLLAVWVTKNVTIRQVVTQFSIPAARFVEPRFYIPVKLPSHSVPGTKTIGPTVERHPARQKLLVAARSPELWGVIGRRT